MNSDDILDLIEKIAATSKRTEKKQLLDKVKMSAMAMEIFQRALDPFITFGVTRKEFASSGKGTNTFSVETVQLLMDLGKRKLSGNAALDAIEDHLETMTEKSVELFWRVISKDLRCGMAASSVNEVWPNLIKVFDLMLAEPLDEKRLEFPVIVEPKLDGVRVCAKVDAPNKHVEFLSRSGKPFTTFNVIKKDLLKAFEQQKLAWMLDGEVVTGSFNKTVSEVRRKEGQAEDAVFYIFDGMSWFNFASMTDAKPLLKRWNSLLRDSALSSDGLPAIQLIPQRIAYTVDEVHAIYAEYRAQGFEGAIVKHIEAPYEKKRSHSWMKMKNQDSVDAPVVGVFEGTGKYEGLMGGLIVELESGVKVRVGSGLSDDQRKEFWKAWHDGELEGRIVEVEYHEYTPDGSLRHPRFVRFRDSLTGSKE